MRRLLLTSDTLDIPLSVVTPLGDFSILGFVYRGCVICLDDVQFMVDLIVLFMSEFDMILGMNWLSSYHVKIDCFAKTICLRVPGRADLVVATSRGNPLAEAFLVHIEEVLQQDQSDTLKEIHVISEFEDVLQDIPNLPPVREVEFYIVVA